MSAPRPYSPKPKPNLIRLVTRSTPLLITVIVHVVLIAIAGIFVVHEQIIGKKNIMEASAPPETSPSMKQVEHRLQVARKGGGSASSSPVSAARIFSTAENALQMPSMPDLPSVGASSLSGMGFGSGIGAIGTGSGYNTGGLSTNGLGGSGFMSMSFLGTTSNRVSKIVFIVDISASAMDIRKGGYRAFSIIRDQMLQLVSRLPVSAQFNIVVFDNGQRGESTAALFASELQPASAANKERFFTWMQAINASPAGPFGMATATNHVKPDWKVPDSTGLDPTYGPPGWLRAIQASLTQKPDTIFLVTSDGGLGSHGEEVSAGEVERRRKEAERATAEKRAELERAGFNIETVNAARGAAFEKARRELAAINAKLISQKKPPFVVTDIRRVFAPDFQAELRKAGFPPIKLDTTGWTDKKGEQIWFDGAARYAGYNRWGADVKSATGFISRLQRTYVPTNATINLFLFVGPDEKTDTAERDLSAISTRNNGRFQLLTTKRLEEIAAQQKSGNKDPS